MRSVREVFNVRNFRCSEVARETQTNRRLHDDCCVVQTSEGTNVHYSIPYHVSPDFIGRDDILRQMSTVCLPRGPQHSQSFQKRYVLFGLGGSGKTQVCLKFAQDHRER